MIHGKKAFHNGEPYLTRWFLKGDGKGESWELYLHRIHRPDVDARPHNHPWPWFLSFVLWGWYEEKRIVYGEDENGRAQQWRPIRRRWFNLLRGKNVFHRISAVSDRPVYTLVLVPPKSKPYGWGYASGVGFVDHRRAHKQILGHTEDF